MFIYVVSWDLDRESTVVAAFDSEDKAQEYCNSRNNDQLCLQNYSYEEIELQ